jgi:spermidine synthase
MVPWELIERTAVSPSSVEELSLFARGDEFSIRLDRCELMNSRQHGSEEALAELALAKLAFSKRAQCSAPQVLIGGLGLGYTVRAALDRLSPQGRIVVAELVPAVVRWNRGPLAHLAGHPLDDARVSVREANVADILKSERGRYEAVLLDVDNGPSGLTQKGNNWLYSEAGLIAAWKSLRPTGVLAVWSATPDRAFSRRLSTVGFQVEEVQARARAARGGTRHTIWLGQRGS